jgi:hypothetical protein
MSANKEPLTPTPEAVSAAELEAAKKYADQWHMRKVNGEHNPVWACEVHAFVAGIEWATARGSRPQGEGEPGDRVWLKEDMRKYVQPTEPGWTEYVSAEKVERLHAEVVGKEQKAVAAWSEVERLRKALETLRENYAPAWFRRYGIDIESLTPPSGTEPTAPAGSTICPHGGEPMFCRVCTAGTGGEE